VKKIRSNDSLPKVVAFFVRKFAVDEQLAFRQCRYAYSKWILITIMRIVSFTVKIGTIARRGVRALDFPTVTFVC